MKSSLLTLTLTLGALSAASAATIPRGGGADDTTTDPMLFMYKISFNETCSTLSWDGLQAFRRSHMPAGGCLPIADFAGRSDEQIRTVLVLETINNGECAIRLYPDAECAGTTYTQMLSLQCSHDPWYSVGGWKSLSVNNCV